MKQRIKRHFIKYLVENGYKICDDPLIVGRGDNSRWMCYCKKYRTYYVATCATCTGQLLIEILKSHCIFRVDKDFVKV